MKIVDKVQVKNTLLRKYGCSISKIGIIERHYATKWHKWFKAKVFLMDMGEEGTVFVIQRIHLVGLDHIGHLKIKKVCHKLIHADAYLTCSLFLTFLYVSKYVCEKKKKFASQFDNNEESFSIVYINFIFKFILEHFLVCCVRNDNSHLHMQHIHTENRNRLV